VGGGPAGLIAALTLRRNDIPIRIIDRRDAFPEAIRGTSIQPRTLEILESLGVLDDVMSISTPPYMMAVHGVGKEILQEIKWADEVDESPGIPYVGPINLHQSMFENVLRKNLEKLGTKVELGVELVGLEQSKDKVIAHIKSEEGDTAQAFQYIIGADGARGSMRRLLGLSFLGETKESDKMFVANVECTDIDRTHWHRWGEFGVKIFFMKPVPPAPTFHIQAMGVELPIPAPQDDEGIQAMFNDISKSTDIQLRNTSWVSEWGANIRMANKFSVGRVFLVGDSAHCHSPAGGQGTNTGVMDALNVSWKLALVQKHLASPSLLDTYEAERMPVVAEMLHLTNELHHLAFSRMPPSTLEAGRSEGRPGDPMWRPKQGLLLGVNYRWSPIVLEGREFEGEETLVEKSPYGVAGDMIRAGDRAPDATILKLKPVEEQTRLFKVIGGGNLHTILVFAGRQPRDLGAEVQDMIRYRQAGVASINLLAPSASTPQDIQDVGRYVDVGGVAYAGYEVSEDQTTYVVIRPDGMIGAYATSVAQVHRFFSLIMSEGVSM
ncbi:hypothetical protein HETIRDRAFT_325575, partial [Heterobasidion irregulare TC 32-1]